MEELAKKITDYLKRKLSPQASEYYAEEKKAAPFSVHTFCDLTDKQSVHLTRIIELILKEENTLVYDFNRPCEKNNRFDIFSAMYLFTHITFYYEEGGFLWTYAVANLAMSAETNTWQYTFNSGFIKLISRIKDKLNKNAK